MLENITCYYNTYYFKTLSGLLTILLESIANTDDTSLEKYCQHFQQYFFLKSVANTFINTFTDTSANITSYINQACLVRVQSNWKFDHFNYLTISMTS